MPQDFYKIQEEISLDHAVLKEQKIDRGYKEILNQILAQNFDVMKKKERYDVPVWFKQDFLTSRRNIF